MTSAEKATAELPRRYGKYELLERIGEGGMAEAFRARLPGAAGFEKILVIKRILPHLAKNERFLQMFVNEAKLAARLQHQNIVHVFELGETDSGELFMAMEYVQGHDLRAILEMAAERVLRIPVWFSVHAMMQALNGLAHAHELVDENGRPLGVIHRDVTPSNVFVSFLGEVKLADFGVAKAINQLMAPGPSDTQGGQLKGKTSYMPPEQIQGLSLDPRADVFSAAVVLWELLTQRRLFGGRGDFEIMLAICEEPRPEPSRFNSAVPPELDAIVLRALEPDRERRYPTARAFHEALLEVMTWYRPKLLPADVRHVVEVLAGRRPSDPVLGADIPSEPSSADEPIPLTVRRRSSAPPAPGIEDGPTEVRTRPRGSSSPPSGPVWTQPTKTQARSHSATDTAWAGETDAWRTADEDAAWDEGEAVLAAPLSSSPPPGPPEAGPPPPRTAMAPRNVIEAPASWSVDASQAPLPWPGMSARAREPGRPTELAAPPQKRTPSPRPIDPSGGWPVPAAPRPGSASGSEADRRGAGGHRTPTGSDRADRFGPPAKGWVGRAIPPQATTVTEELPRWEAETTPSQPGSGPYFGPHPFFTRGEDGQVRGPLDYATLAAMLEQGAAAIVEVSPDGDTWYDRTRFAFLAGLDAFLPERAALRNVTTMGMLEEQSLVQVFAKLGLNQATGRLMVMTGSNLSVRREIVLTRGALAYVFADRTDLNLPTIALRRELISRDRLDAAVHMALLEQIPFDEGLRRALGSRSTRYRGILFRERLVEIFRWRQGKFAFDASFVEPPPFGTIAPSVLGPLFELVTRCYDIQELRAKLSTVLGARLGPSSHFDWALRDLDLGRTLEGAAHRLGEGKTIGQLIRRSPDQEMEFLALAYVLLESEALVRS
ncbi:MAG: protein kinase [Myxococcota bacterium]